MWVWHATTSCHFNHLTLGSNDSEIAEISKQRPSEHKWFNKRFKIRRVEISLYKTSRRGPRHNGWLPQWEAASLHLYKQNHFQSEPLISDRLLWTLALGNALSSLPHLERAWLHAGGYYLWDDIISEGRVWEPERPRLEGSGIAMFVKGCGNTDQTERYNHPQALSHIHE